MMTVSTYTGDYPVSIPGAMVFTGVVLAVIGILGLFALYYWADDIPSLWLKKLLPIGVLVAVTGVLFLIGAFWLAATLGGF